MYLLFKNRKQIDTVIYYGVNYLYMKLCKLIQINKGVLKVIKRLFFIFIVIILLTNSIHAFASPQQSQVHSFDEFVSINNINLDSINYLTVKDIIDANKQKLGNVKVAIIDTGIDTTHPDLKDNIIPGYNFVDNSNNMYDNSGHGTLLAGVIGGKQTGIANGVKIMPVKVLDGNGFGKTENLVKGIIWAVDNGANIINISIGRSRFVKNEDKVERDTFSEIEYKAIEYALMNNVTVVLPAGNFQENELCYPAAYVYKKTIPKPIIVSGFYNDKKFFWSNISPLIDVSAPADNILSTIPKELDKNISEYYNIDNDGYSFCGGTSISCAYITAMAAVLKSFNNELTNEQIRTIINESAKDLGEKGRDKEFGYGKIDFRKSLLSQRLNVKSEKVEFYEGDICTLNIKLDNYEGKIIKEFQKYHDPKDDIINVEAETMEEAEKKAKEQMKVKKEDVKFDNRVQIDVYQYLEYQDIYVLKENYILNMDKSETTRYLPLKISGIYKIMVSNPSNMLIGNQYYLKVKPKEPKATLKQGIHIGTKKVEFQSDEEGVEIYYTLGDVPVSSLGEINSIATRFDKALSIDKSTVVNVVIRKNGVVSEVVKFKYTVINIYILIISVLALAAVGTIVFIKIFSKRRKI